MKHLFLFFFLAISFISSASFAQKLAIALDDLKVYTFENPMLIKSRQEVDSKKHEQSEFFKKMKESVDGDPTWGTDSKKLTDCVQGNLRSDLGQANGKVWSVEAYTVMCASQRSNSNPESIARFEGEYRLFSGNPSVLKLNNANQKRLLMAAFGNEEKETKKETGIDCALPSNKALPSCKEELCRENSQYTECRGHTCKRPNEVPIYYFQDSKFAQPTDWIRSLNQSQLEQAVGSSMSARVFKKLKELEYFGTGDFDQDFCFACPAGTQRLANVCVDRKGCEQHEAWDPKSQSCQRKFCEPQRSVGQPNVGQGCERDCARSCDAAVRSFTDCLDRFSYFEANPQSGMNGLSCLGLEIDNKDLLEKMKAPGWAQARKELVSFFTSNLSKAKAQKLRCEKSPIACDDWSLRPVLAKLIQKHDLQSCRPDEIHQPGQLIPCVKKVCAACLQAQDQISDWQRLWTQHARETAIQRIGSCPSADMNTATEAYLHSSQSDAFWNLRRCLETGDGSKCKAFAGLSHYAVGDYMRQQNISCAFEATSAGKSQSSQVIGTD